MNTDAYNNCYNEATVLYRGLAVGGGSGGGGKGFGHMILEDMDYLAGQMSAGFGCEQRIFFKICKIHGLCNKTDPILSCMKSISGNIVISSVDANAK